MLSYQHVYHAGNFADVQKHALLAWMLDYLTRKPKPLTYIETHAGRGLYDLASAEAQKTQEHLAGIDRLSAFFPEEHPFMRVLTATRAERGETFYPGSPLIATSLLRPEDKKHFSELHRSEYGGLTSLLAKQAISLQNRDGFESAHALCPPLPRRGLMFIDPSYEVKTEYSDLPSHIAKITKAWNVGVIAIWYPILRDDRHARMLERLRKAHPDAQRHEVTGVPARASHGMIGSGLFVINPPFGLKQAADDVAKIFQLAF